MTGPAPPDPFAGKLTDCTKHQIGKGRPFRNGRSAFTGGWWTRSQNIRTEGEVSFEAALTELSKVPVYQAIAEQTAHLHLLGMNPNRIGVHRGVDEHARRSFVRQARALVFKATVLIFPPAAAGGKIVSAGRRIPNHFSPTSVSRPHQGASFAGSSRISISALAQYTRSRFPPLTSETIDRDSSFSMARCTVVNAIPISRAAILTV